MRGTSRFVALALLSVALSGCLGGKPPKNLIGLTPVAAAPAGPLGAGKLSQAIIVLDPQADRRIDVVRVPVQVDDSKIEYVKDLTWVEKPTRQFRQLLAETIRAKGNRLVLEEVDELAGGQARLGGRLTEMGYDARSQSVVVKFDALREDGSGNVRSQRFEASVPGVSPKPDQIGPALNKAANEVAQQVADWVG